jgi:hypothetical protein
MRRIMLVLTVALVMAAMLVVMAAPALAAPQQADRGLSKAYVKSGGKAPPPSDECDGCTPA